jgi:hypothetical protein
VGEAGRDLLFVLEATFDDAALATRIVTLMEGAQGIIVPPDILDRELPPG